MTSFYDLPLSDDVLDAIWDMHFEECTPVQEQCIPHLLEGRDVIGIAQTGTGKTAAYLLPILTLLQQEPHPTDAVNCLIMAPTRELARQIDQALQGFAYYMDINGVAVYGGNDGQRYEQERRALSQGADIVIATPGRLISHLSLGNFDLSRTTHLILDEADRMLDMGFSDDILQIVKCLPKERQTILFSATMPKEITALAHSIMRNPVEVKIAVSKPAENIDQGVFICNEVDKMAILQNLFKQTPPQRVILFARSKQNVKQLAAQLRRSGYNCHAMHSDLEQKERDDVMNEFKARHIDLLVATDIVSRGIDIDDITMVINYDAPHDPEDYVHRIGRTARAGKDGRAVTFVSERDRPALRAIERLLEKQVPRLPLPEGISAPDESSAATRGGHSRGRGGHRHGHGSAHGRSRGKNGGKAPQGSKNHGTRNARGKK
ncbi:MAG: DEAD/DEAH box helicase [Bacteroidaceae bacterium]|nr:DEAD/DEAH box helicase [Bacteroidaceae bacterium]